MVDELYAAHKSVYFCARWYIPTCDDDDDSDADDDDVQCFMWPADAAVTINTAIVCH